MKTRRPGLLALILLMIGVMAGLQARATKNNVGTRLPDLHLEFSGDVPKCEGRPLLVEFWATSCSSCRESVSHLNALYGKFKPRGLEALGVTDDDEPTVKAFEKDFPISYAVGHDRRGRLASAMGVVALPHAMLVDKGGKIVWEGHPLNITESQLTDLVK
jgi:peroxiredoxin